MKSVDSTTSQNKIKKRKIHLIIIASIVAVGMIVALVFAFVNPSNHEGGDPELYPQVIGEIFGLPITETMFSAIITVGIIIIFALIIRIFFIPKWSKNLGKAGVLQSLLEFLIGGVTHNVEELITPHIKNKKTPIIGFWFFGVVVYIFIGTCIEMLGFRPPTSELSFTLVLGIFTFLFIHIFGAIEAAKHKRGLRRLLHYVNPITLVTDSVVPVSMALRLFISVFSGYLIMHLIYGVVSVGVPVIGHVMFTLFHAFVQSYVFLMLSLSFISEAIE